MARKKMKLRELFNDQMIEESINSLGFEYLSTVRNIRNHLKVAQQYSDGVVTSQMEGATDEMVGDFEKLSNDITAMLERLKKSENDIIGSQDVIDLSIQ